VKIPYRWTLARPSGAIHDSGDRGEAEHSVDEAKFAKPAAEQNGPAK